MAEQDDATAVTPRSIAGSLPPAALRVARRNAWLYLGAAVALLPWIAYLAVSLPSRDLDLNYRASWVGFDVLLVIALLTTAYMAFRVDARIAFPATVTATLLVVDAWFDITTSDGRGQLIEAILLAALIEIPAAIFSLRMARRVEHRVFEQAGLLPSPETMHPGSVPEPTDPD
ncbi:MAG: hypothetical protein JO085_12760 [Acidimicrobiia bacterium]|nr:hypothetical protein [Acidimicrobiia bacterium]